MLQKKTNTQILQITVIAFTPFYSNSGSTAHGVGNWDSSAPVGYSNGIRESYFKNHGKRDFHKISAGMRDQHSPFQTLIYI